MELNGFGQTFYLSATLKQITDLQKSTSQTLQSVRVSISILRREEHTDAAVHELRDLERTLMQIEDECESIRGDSAFCTEVNANR